MLTKIKALADEAIKLQNKNRMDEVLREISALCEVKQIPTLERAIKYDVPTEVIDKLVEVNSKLHVAAKGAKNAK